MHLPKKPPLLLAFFLVFQHNMQGARGRIDGTGQRRPIYVVVKTYLLFPGHGQRLSQEPHHRFFRRRARLPQSELTMVLLYWFELQSISKLCAEL